MTDHNDDIAPVAPAAAPPADIYDATATPGVTQLPAVTTTFSPADFKAWLAAEGEMYIVWLPNPGGGPPKSFIIKVPHEHNAFFVAMMQQIRFCLGNAVQAVRAQIATGEPPAADGTATEAPDWAQPPGDHAPPTEHVYTDDDPPPDWDGLAKQPRGFA